MNAPKSARMRSYYDQFANDYTEKGLHFAVMNSPGLGVYKKAALKNRIQAFLREK